MAAKPRNTRQRITGEVLNKYTAEQLEKYINQKGRKRSYIRSAFNYAGLNPITR